MRNISKTFFRLIVGLLLALYGAISCSVVKPIPREEVIYTYKDSVNFKDSTVYHHLYKEYYKDVNHLLVWHGRNICNARNPKCDECPVKEYCEFYKENKKIR